jgi:hypothetical protein
MGAMVVLLLTFAAVAGEPSAPPGIAGTNASWASPAAPGSHQQHSTAYISLAFLFLALVIGAVTEYLTSRHCHSLPYTCTILVEGVLIGAWYEWMERGHLLEKATFAATLTESIKQWISIDPHLLLYAFLPALLFGDTMVGAPRVGSVVEY